MVLTLAFLFVLALSSTCSCQTKVEELTNLISSKVTDDLARVAEAARGTDTSTLELNNKLLQATKRALDQMKPEIQELGKLSGGSADVGKKLGRKISQSQVLKNVLASEGKLAPRFIGALVLGITQLATDVVKMSYTRY